MISRKERHATSVCKFADASVRRFLQCINDEAVSYAGIDIKRLPWAGISCIFEGFPYDVCVDRQKKIDSVT